MKSNNGQRNTVQSDNKKTVKGLMQLHNRMKCIIWLIVNNDHRNSLVKIEKYHHSISEHLNDKDGFHTMDK